MRPSWRALHQRVVHASAIGSRSAVLVDVVVRATTISLELRPPQYGSVLLDDVALRLRIGYIYEYRRFDRCICFDNVL